MIHVFIDTNIFLSLYAFTDDNIDELKKLVRLIEGKHLCVMMTSVVNQEFYRNRDKKLAESIAQVEKFVTSIGIPRFMEHYPEAKVIREALSSVREQKGSLIERAIADIRDHKLAADELFIQIRNLSKLHNAKDVEELAKSRMERGNPPGKSDSLGDRQNWELLLKVVPNGADLHVVSRDKDFASPLGTEIPNSYLSMEWSATKKSTLCLYSDIRSFTKKHFPEIKVSADAVKVKSLKSLIGSTSFAMTHDAIAKLNTVRADIAAAEARDLFLALIDNVNINWISEDDDVRDFYEFLWAEHWDVLSNEEREKAEGYVADPIPF